MAEQFSAQNSITIRRLRTGDTLFIALENDRVLYQAVDEETGAVNPDWSKAENQPTITPNVQSSIQNNSVTLDNHEWTYNGTKLSFTGDAASGWKTDSTSKFQLNTSTGALKIIKNLASATNLASDTLTYSAIATSFNVHYNLSKSIDILIQKSSANAYAGFITAKPALLSNNAETSTLTTTLLYNGNPVTDYHTKWYLDNEEWTGQDDKKSTTIGRSQVNGTQLIFVNFYKEKEYKTLLFRAGAQVSDTADEYIINFSFADNHDVEDGKSVQLTASIVNITTKKEVTPSSATWRMDIMDKDTWTVIRSVDTSTITVTNADTDTKDGKIRDVEVLAEVTWSE